MVHVNENTFCERVHPDDPEVLDKDLFLDILIEQEKQVKHR